MGIYTKSVQRQLFDIHHALLIDRPTLEKPLLNDEMLSYATEVISNFIFVFIYLNLLFK